MSQIAKTICLTPIHRNSLRPFIRFAFQGDQNLLNNIHIAAPGSLDELTDHTYLNLLQLTADNGTCFCSVVYSSDKDYQIGFTVSVHYPMRILMSFGLNISYRKKEIVNTWLDCVCKDLFEGKKFAVALYQKNQRAIRFFNRHGFHQSKLTDNNLLLWQ